VLSSDRFGYHFSLSSSLDWLPTLMGVATNNQWDKPLSGKSIDGINMWDSLTNPSFSSLSIEKQNERQHTEIVHYLGDQTESPDLSCIQFNNMKYHKEIRQENITFPTTKYYHDYHPDLASEKCSSPTILMALPSFVTIVKFIIPNSVALAFAMMLAATLMMVSILSTASHSFSSKYFSFLLCLHNC
jgi:hypothetical protein